MPLHADLRVAINAGLRGGCRIRAGKTHEVDALVGLFRTALPKLDAALTNALAPLGLSVRVGGIFCHSSSMLTHDGGTCEIGDLLIVVRYAGGAAAVQNALLVQTKIADDLDRGTPQFTLYTSWPRFEWERTRETRQVRPSRPHLGAQYGFLELCEAGCSHCCLSVGTPDGSTRDFASELIDVVLHASGRAFADERRARRGRNWDRVIWDLLLGTVRRADFTWRAAGERGTPRDFNITGMFLHRGSAGFPLIFQGTEVEAAVQRVAGDDAESLLPPPEGPFDPEFSEVDRALIDGDDGISFVIVEFGRAEAVSHGGPVAGDVN